MDFRSDTVTRPTPAMREAIARAQVGDDVFGDDPGVRALQHKAASWFGFEAALFMPSGTQANLVALMTHCQRGDEAIVGQQSHHYRWEGGGMAVLGSIQPQPLENLADGSLDLDAVAAAIKPDDPHFPRTRLLALENTIGGKVLGLPYLRQAGELARRRGLAIHLDGARLINAAVETARQRPPGINGNESGPADRTDKPAGSPGTQPDAAPGPTAGAIMQAAKAICESFDSVSICLSKGLGAPVGSLLLGPSAWIGRAVRVRKMLGGGMRQAGILAAAGVYALDHHVERIAQDHANALRLAQGLHALSIGQPLPNPPGPAQSARADSERAGRLSGQLTVQIPQTNIVFVTVRVREAASFGQFLEQHGVRCTGSVQPDGSVLQRWVTHLDIDGTAIDRALELAAQYDRSGQTP
jgi:threonine aldolase